MNFSVYEAMRKIEFMHRMIERVDLNESLDNYADDIREILEEYSSILQSAKVKI